MKKLRPYLKILCSFAIVFALAACQPTDQEWAAFCQNTRWAEHGYFDAKEGFPVQMATAYQERCGNQLSREDLKQYQLGFLKGIKEFCTQQKGYELGLANKPDPETCPPELRKAFLAGFKQGRGEYHEEQVALRQWRTREQDKDDRSFAEEIGEINRPGAH